MIEFFVAAVICLAFFAALYLLMIMPRIWGKPDMKPFKEWLYAHRGLHDNETDAPENSLRAFQKATEAGYGIELDIQLTKDKVPVVFHDFTLKRICGAEEKVCDFTCEELQRFRLCGTDQTIPRFEKVLELVGGRVPLIVELKAEGKDVSVCQAADSLLKDYQGMYCIESFNPLCVLWYRRNRKEIVRGQLSESFLREKKRRSFLYFVLQNLLLNWLGKPDFVAYNHMHYRALSRRLCRGLYRNTAAAWTIRSAKQLEEARKHFDIYIFEGFLP